MAVASRTTDSSGDSPLPTPSTSRSGLSAGAIAGIVVGIVVAFLILACVVFIYFRRRRVSRREEATNAGPQEIAFPQYPPPLVQNQPATGKDIPELSPKQVLGLDDASYLGRLPTQYEQTSNLAVRPAYVAPQFDRLLGIGNGSSPPDPDQIAVRGVNPWDVEHGPNSVIFPHLSKPLFELHGDGVPAELPGDLTYSRNNDQDVQDSPVGGSKSRASRFEAFSSNIKRLKRSRSVRTSASPEVELEMMDISSSEDTAHSNCSTVADHSLRTLSPATTSSTISSVDKGKGPVKDPELFPAEEVEFTSFNVTLPEHPDEDLAMDIDPVSVAAAMALVPPPLMLAIPLRDTEFHCSKCPEVFRLPGLLRNHENRKHNLRYACHLCEVAFGLRADLERHKVTKHSKELGPKPAKVFKCPNTACLTPEKEYFRKDNFMRHTRRCQNARARVKVKKQADKELG